MRRSVAPLLALLSSLSAAPAVSTAQRPSEWWLGGGGGGGITPGSVLEPTASPLVLTSCAPALITNRSMAGTLQVNLCRAKKGMEVFIIWENAAQTVSIEPKDPTGSVDTISTPEVTGSGDGLTWTAVGTVGSVVHLICLSDGEWRVISMKGAAAVDNNSGPDENP